MWTGCPVEDCQRQSLSSNPKKKIHVETIEKVDRKHKTIMKYGHKVFWTNTCQDDDDDYWFNVFINFPSLIHL